MDKLSFDFRKWLYGRRTDIGTILIGVIIIVFGIVLFFGYTKYFVPVKDKLFEQKDSLYLFEANVSKIPELTLTSEMMNTKVNDIKDIYSQLNSIIPDKRNVPFVSSQISLAAAYNKVDIASMTKVVETTVTLGDDVFGVVKYNLVSFSTYENIVNLLATLETSKSIFAIEKIHIEPLSEKEMEKFKDASLVKTTLDINIFMRTS